MGTIRFDVVIDPSDSANSQLDSIVCRGVAGDVYDALHAQQLLEELDGYVAAINATGVGKIFFANLQFILKRNLCLSISRLYEGSSPRNPGRSVPAAIEFIRSHAAQLRIVNRQLLIEYLTTAGESEVTLRNQPDEQLSLIVVRYLRGGLPKADTGSNQPLDQALTKIKKVRDKAIAHNERIDRASLTVPAWQTLAELIEFARRFVELVATAYLNVHHNIERDANKSSMSLRRLLEKAGLTPTGVPTT